MKKQKIDTKRIAAVADKIKKGEIELPDLDLESNDEWEAVWALLDSGSSVHVVNMSKHLPGAKIRRAPRGARGFQTADGKTIPDKGSAITPMRTVEGLERCVHWKNADVALPILSTNLIAQNNAELRYREKDGTIHHLDTGDTTDFIAASGVYFLKIYLPKDITKGKCKLPEGFVRQD